MSKSAVSSDIRNSAVNTFRWNQQTSETSVMKGGWGDPHQDKTHRLTGGQMAIPLNMGGSCSYLFSSIYRNAQRLFYSGGKRKKSKIDD